MTDAGIRITRPGNRFGPTAALVRAEWTKFRTVPGWVIAIVVAGLLIVLFAVLAGASSVQHGRPAVPTGPGGEPVTDDFYLVHRPLTGNGSITVRATSLNDQIASGRQGLRPAVVPWAKAGLIIRASARQGSPYAAIMITSSHGVRMQYDYTHDAAGLPGAASASSPRWLRLTRSGGTVTGYDSADGIRWAKVGSVHLAGLGSAGLGGLFVASPDAVQGMGTVTSVATATFGHPRPRGRWLGGDWASGQVGAASSGPFAGSFTQARGRFTVTGSGDIAPAVRETLGGAGVISDILFGTFPALITVIVVGALFITAEYREGLIRTTLAATPRRVRVLLAKALVLAVVTFAAGLAGSLIAVPLGQRLARANGVYLFPVTGSAQLRVEFGTAALLAAAAVLALAVGTIFRRSAGAVTAVFVAIVLPYLIVIASPLGLLLPASVSTWLTRLTPAAAFAVQQTLTPYHQVASIYTPYNGYYPLSPWAGLAVLCGYAALALAVAAVLLRRRDV